MKLPAIHNPIRAFAVFCVAVISAYIMWMGWRLSGILASPGWCNRALTADKIDADSKFDALQACIGLLTIQVKSVATVTFIYAAVIALCLLTLIVIVIAGGKLSLSASRSGVNANIGKDDVGQAAQAVADEAQDAADAIRTSAKAPAPTDEPGIPDYAKP